MLALVTCPDGAHQRSQALPAARSCTRRDVTVVGCDGSRRWSHLINVIQGVAGHTLDNGRTCGHTLDNGRTCGNSCHTCAAGSAWA